MTVERVTAGLGVTYTLSGEAGSPPMVLLHGLGEGRISWQPLIPALAEHFRVFAPDLRGHGDSDWPGSYSFPLMRDDVVAFLGALGLGQVTLVGHSMGGAVAFMIAMRHPELVERLVVEDATPGYRRERAIPGRPEGPLPFDWPLVPAIAGAVNAGEPGGWEHLGDITAPTLLIGGGPDSSVRADKLAEAASLIPDCDLITIPAGHNIHENRPVEFTDAVLSWLGLR